MLLIYNVTTDIYFCIHGSGSVSGPSFFFTLFVYLSITASIFYCINDYRSVIYLFTVSNTHALFFLLKCLSYFCFFSHTHESSISSSNSVRFLVRKLIESIDFYFFLCFWMKFSFSIKYYHWSWLCIGMLLILCVDLIYRILMKFHICLMVNLIYLKVSMNALILPINNDSLISSILMKKYLFFLFCYMN